MSTFLMNPATSYVEPKFPPADEYSQNDYIQTSQVGTHDGGYYGASGLTHGFGYSAPPLTHDARRYVGGSLAAETPYASTNQVNGYGLSPVSAAPMNLSNGTLAQPQSYGQVDHARTSPNTRSPHLAVGASSGHTHGGPGGAAGPQTGPTSLSPNQLKQTNTSGNNTDSSLKNGVGIVYAWMTKSHSKSKYKKYVRKYLKSSKHSETNASEFWETLD